MQMVSFLVRRDGGGRGTPSALSEGGRNDRGEEPARGGLRRNCLSDIGALFMMLTLDPKLGVYHAIRQTCLITSS
jgi:hypothetical protein